MKRKLPFSVMPSSSVCAMTRSQETSVASEIVDYPGSPGHPVCANCSRQLTARSSWLSFPLQSD
jgi:hypothetical protein